MSNHPDLAMIALLATLVVIAIVAILDELRCRDIDYLDIVERVVSVRLSSRFAMMACDVFVAVIIGYNVLMFYCIGFGHAEGLEDTWLLTPLHFLFG